MTDRYYRPATNVLVSGGAGFLGSHLCERLLKLGYQVTCVDNLSSGSAANIKLLLNHPHFKFIQHDIITPLLAVKSEKIFNLACPASPVQYQEDPVSTTRTAVLGAINMLDLARTFNATIYQASTSEVYGNPSAHPQTEDYRGNVNPVGPRSCYDEGKRCAETLFFDYWRQYQVKIKVARIFNTYGPRMRPDDGRVISNFIVQALRNQRITIYGDGDQTRSFCYVDDLVDSMLLFMDTPDSLRGPINFGNTEELSMLSLAQRIIDLTGSSSKIVFLPIPEDDPVHRQPDIALAREKLGWQPRTNIEQGLTQTISWFDALLTNSPQATDV